MGTTGSRTPSARILIVDGSGALMARRTVLEELGHEVHTCASPHDALERCAGQSFDIVVMIYKASKSDVEVVRELRSHHPLLALILISSLKDALGLNESNTGADAVIQKSAHEVGQLIRAVNRALRKPPKPAAAAAKSARRRA